MDPERWEHYADAVESAGGAIRLDLDHAVPGPALSLALVAALEHEPEIIRVPFGVSRGSGPLEQLDGLAAENETALVLGIDRGAGGEDLAAVIEAARSSESVIAFALDRFDEDHVEALGHAKGLALFSPGFEFASAARLGAAAFDGSFGLLGPEACTEALAMATSSPGEALQLERRLLRFIEGAFERATRALSPDERAVALAGTFAYFEEEGAAPPEAFSEGEWEALGDALDELGFFPRDV